MLDCLAAAGTAFQLPPGTNVQTVTAAYARQVVTAVASSIPSDDGTPAKRAYDDLQTALKAAENEVHEVRLRNRAVLAAVTAVGQELPQQVTQIVQPLMAGLRHLPEACFHSEV